MDNSPGDTSFDSPSESRMSSPLDDSSETSSSESELLSPDSGKETSTRKCRRRVNRSYYLQGNGTFMRLMYSMRENLWQ